MDPKHWYYPAEDTKFRLSKKTFPKIIDVGVISSYPPCKDDNARFTTLPLKPYSDLKKCYPLLLVKYKQEILKSLSQRTLKWKWTVWSDKIMDNIISNNAIKGSVRNRAQPYFYEGRSLQITLLLCQGCTKIRRYLLKNIFFMILRFVSWRIPRLNIKYI